MARRRLEEALRASQDMGPGEFTRVEELATVSCGDNAGGVFSFQFSLDGEHLIAGCGNGGIESFNSRTGEQECTVRKHRYGGLQILTLRFHPKNHDTFLAGSADGVVYACKAESDACHEVIKEAKNEINCLDFCMDGHNFATAGKDMTVRIYDSNTQKLVRDYGGHNNSSALSDTPKQGHGMRVFAMRFHPENNDIFVTGGWENHIKIWDMRTDVGVRRTIHGPHICGDALDIKGFEILTGSWIATKSLQVWDYSSGDLKQTVPFQAKDGAYLYSAHFANDDIILAGGSGTNSAQAVNRRTGQMLGEVELGKPVQALDSTHNGRLFCIGGGKDEFKLCSLK